MPSLSNASRQAESINHFIRERMLSNFKRWFDKSKVMASPEAVTCSLRAIHIQCRRQISTTSVTLAPPSTAPRSSVNIKDIRQNPDLHSRNCILRNYKNQRESPFKIVRLFDEWKELQRNGRGLREKSNAIRTRLSHRKTFSGCEIETQSTGGAEMGKRGDLREEARSLKHQIGQIESQEAELNTSIESLASDLPNLTSPATPSSNLEPQIIDYINVPPSHFSSSASAWRNHLHLGMGFGLLDFSSAGTTSGWGWYYLKNEAALLEQALVQFSLSVAMQRGFKVVTPPSIVYSHIASASGFRPRDQNGEQQVYAIQQNDRAKNAGKPELCLAGTAEIPFAALKANTMIPETDLPDIIIGTSRCYRAEAGARGLETKGLYRVHEFTKVEMFGWTLPDRSEELFHQMISIQTQILSDLGLYCRVLEMPAHDLGASAYRKQDIEAYFPSRKEKGEGWGEITSTSMCTDYQSRRLATRVKSKEGVIDFPHTVNGTAMAVPRVLAALLENGWNEEEELITVPEVLWPWMHGCRVIRKKKG